MKISAWLYSRSWDCFCIYSKSFFCVNNLFAWRYKYAIWN